MGIGTTDPVVFLRFPRPGKVKSWLAQTLGVEEATVFYQLCAEKIARELDQLPGEVNKYLSCSDNGDKDEIMYWIGRQFRLIPQAEGDLGQRLEQTYQGLLEGISGKADRLMTGKCNLQ